jgi:hypothetical protein
MKDPFAICVALAWGFVFTAILVILAHAGKI